MELHAPSFSEERVLLVSQELTGGPWRSRVWLSPALLVLVPLRGSLERSREESTAVVKKQRATGRRKSLAASSCLPFSL